MRHLTIGSRLAAARRALRLKVSEFGTLTDIPESSLKKYESDHSKPGSDAIQSFAKAGINIHWLMTGDGPMMLDRCKTQQPESPLMQVSEEMGAEYARVPLYDVHAAAGHGAVVEHEQVIDSLAFKREWIERALHANPADLYLIYVDGESMEPTLRPGDVILVNSKAAQAVPRDGIYVLRMDDTLLVKRFQRLPGRKVKVTSDNAAYQSFDIELDNGHSDSISIIGRVVWAGRRM